MGVNSLAKTIAKKIRDQTTLNNPRQSLVIGSNVLINGQFYPMGHSADIQTEDGDYVWVSLDNKAQNAVVIGK